MNAPDTPDGGDAGAGGGGIEGGPDDELAEVVAGCRESHRRLLHAVGGLDDDAVRAPSRLEGWSVGHVLTHLARNADSHTRMLGAALAGEAVEQYTGGHRERAAAIEAGAGRGAPALVEDLARSTADLETAWAAMTPAAWDGHGLARGNPWPCRSMPHARWREVEIHFVDMGIGHEVADWPEAYVRRELPRLLATLPGRLPDGGERRRLLAWLVGRAPDPGRLELERWEARPDGYLHSIAD